MATATPLIDHQQPGGLSDSPLLAVKDLKIFFEASRGIFAPKRFIRAVDGISFEIRRGETLALVGESGCGKTTTARSIVRLVNPRSGSIVFDNTDITKLSGEDLKRYRQRVQFVFQDPYESLNPRQTIFDAIATPIRIHHLAPTRTVLSKKVDKLLMDVNLEPDKTRGKYPHQLSGGQRQRVNIARALATKPDLMIADEPVSMLDVSLRLGVLILLEKLRKTFGLTYLFITHDMAVARQVSNRIAVMYLGRIVEVGDADSVIGRPIHPYTKLLVEATPQLDLTDGNRRGTTVTSEEMKISKVDAIGSSLNLPSGCRFNPRCKYVIKKCTSVEPPLLERRKNQFAACDVVAAEP